MPVAENTHHGPSVRDGLAKGHARPREVKEHLPLFASVSRLEKNWVLPKQNPCLEAQRRLLCLISLPGKLGHVQKVEVIDRLNQKRDGSMTLSPAAGLVPPICEASPKELTVGHSVALALLLTDAADCLHLETSETSA